MSSIAPPGDGFIELGDRSILRITQNSETAVPCPYKSRVTSDNFRVGKRHCRVLHRPHGRWLNRIERWLNRIGRWLNRIGRSIYFTHYPKFGDGSAVSLQIQGYIRPFCGVGKRHCRVLHRFSSWEFPHRDCGATETTGCI